MAIEIKKYNKQDLSENMDLFCDLYHKVFTADANRPIIEQRYLDNPYDELLMYVALDNGKIIANYSAVPIRVVVEGIERKSALSLNTMTDPEYSGKGLFTQLATKLYDYLANNDYSMIIGFPNFMSNRTFNTRLGWNTVLEIPTMKLCLDTYQVPKEVIEGDYFDSFDNIEGNRSNGDIRVDLSRDYLTWRFQNNQEKQYRVLSIDKKNWIIYQFYNDEINLTVINCDDNEKEKKLLSKIISLGIEKRFSNITTWCKLNTERHNYLEKIGFRLSNPIRTFGIRCFDEAILEVVYDPRKWSVQMGDDNTY